MLRRLDAIDATARQSTRHVSERRQFGDGVRSTQATASGAKLDDRVGCLVRADGRGAARACSAPQIVDDQAPLCDAAECAI